MFIYLILDTFSVQMPSRNSRRPRGGLPIITLPRNPHQPHNPYRPSTFYATGAWRVWALFCVFAHNYVMVSAPRENAYACREVRRIHNSFRRAFTRANSSRRNARDEAS